MPGVVPAVQIGLVVDGKVGPVVHQRQRGGAVMMLPIAAAGIIWAAGIAPTRAGRRVIAAGAALRAAAAGHSHWLGWLPRRGGPLPMILIEVAVIEKQLIACPAEVAYVNLPGCLPARLGHVLVH